MQSLRVGESSFMPQQLTLVKNGVDLGSGEPFDDLHGLATLGTAIKIWSVFRRGSVFLGRWFCGCAQQRKAEREKRAAPTVGQEAEVTDAHEALRKEVE